MSHVAVPNDLPFWRRLLALEPAVIKGVIGALVALGLIWGADFTALGDQLTRTADVLGSIVAILTPLWIRQSVTPTSRVVSVANPDGAVVAGPASPLLDGTPVQVQTTYIHILPVDPPA